MAALVQGRSSSDGGTEPPLEKPLLRGWLHAAAVPVALGALVALWVRGLHAPALLPALLIYGVSLVASHLVSAAFHLGRWHGRPLAVWYAVDRAAIFLLIAGTYTPIAVGALDGWWRGAVLGVVWSVAAVGAGLSGLLGRLPRWTSVALYLALGWFAVAAAPSLAAALEPEVFFLLVAGGVCYSGGALVYGRRWPNPVPRLFGYHEVFHLFGILGGAAFLVAIWQVSSGGTP